MTAKTNYNCDLCNRNTIKDAIKVIGVERYYPAGGPTALTPYPATIKKSHICLDCIKDIRNMDIETLEFTGGETLKK